MVIAVTVLTHLQLFYVNQGKVKFCSFIVKLRWHEIDLTEILVTQVYLPVVMPEPRGQNQVPLSPPQAAPTPSVPARLHKAVSMQFTICIVMQIRPTNTDPFNKYSPKPPLGTWLRHPTGSLQGQQEPKPEREHVRAWLWIE